MTTQTALGFAELPLDGEFEVPLDAEPRRCASCGASIYWTRTSAGKAIPLNTTPIRRMNGRRYAMTHFATCPHATNWRKS